MTKQEAHRIALKLAYEAVHKAVESGGEECENDKDQIKVDAALDAIAQRLYERWKRNE